MLFQLAAALAVIVLLAILGIYAIWVSSNREDLEQARVAEASRKAQSEEAARRSAHEASMQALKLKFSSETLEFYKSAAENGLILNFGDSSFRHYKDRLSWSLYFDSAQNLDSKLALHALLRDFAGQLGDAHGLVLSDLSYDYSSATMVFAISNIESLPN